MKKFDQYKINKFEKIIKLLLSLKLEIRKQFKKKNRNEQKGLKKKKNLKRYSFLWDNIQNKRQLGYNDLTDNMQRVYTQQDNRMKKKPSYSLSRVIASGCFGYVFEGADNETGEKVALKRVEKVGNQMSREYEILFMIQDCQNVVRILEFFYSRNQDHKLIQNIVFEYVSDNLQSLITRHIRSNVTIPEVLIKSYAYQLIHGLEQIHAKNIAHRDLKPENVLLSDEGVIKICDFGSAKIIDENGKNTPYVVSRYYRAPELILCYTKYDVSVDIWAAACIMAELFLLTPIFQGSTEGKQLFAIMDVLGSMNQKQKKFYLTEVPIIKNILTKLDDCPKANLKNIFWMVQDQKNFIDLLEKMLRFLPEERISAKEALAHPFFSDIRNMKKRPVETERKKITILPSANLSETIRQGEIRRKNLESKRPSRARDTQNLESAVYDLDPQTEQPESDAQNGRR